MTKLIGYMISFGTFTPQGSDEQVEYSNRVLRCITDEGADAENIGLSSFEKKLKTSVIADCLKCPDTEKDVNAALNQLLNKPITFKFAARSGKYDVVGFYPDTK